MLTRIMSLIYRETVSVSIASERARAINEPSRTNERTNGVSFASFVDVRPARKFRGTRINLDRSRRRRSREFARVSRSKTRCSEIFTRSPLGERVNRYGEKLRSIARRDQDSDRVTFPKSGSVKSEERHAGDVFPFFYDTLQPIAITFALL